MESKPARSQAATFDRFAQLPLVLMSTAMIVSAVLKAPWGVTFGIVAASFLWFVGVRKTRVHPLAYAGLAIAAGCILLQRFASLDSAVDKVVNLVFLGVVVALLIFAAFQLVSAGFAGLREITTIKSQVHPRKH
jgi:hypothetical protein